MRVRKESLVQESLKEESREMLLVEKGRESKDLARDCKIRKGDLKDLKGWKILKILMIREGGRIRKIEGKNICNMNKRL